MRDPLELAGVLVKVTDTLIAERPATGVPAATIDQLSADVGAERKVLRDWPRAIDDTASLLTQALGNLVDARAQGDAETAVEWLRVVQALRPMVARRLNQARSVAR
jgi:hypothetical protein